MYKRKGCLQKKRVKGTTKHQKERKQKEKSNESRSEEGISLFRKGKQGEG